MKFLVLVFVALVIIGTIALLWLGVTARDAYRFLTGDHE